MVRSDIGHPLPQLPKPRFEVLRYSSGKDSTLGLLFKLNSKRSWLCYTLEDEARTQKVHGETRIPAGTYQLLLRTEGGFHERYKKKFPDIHEGMIWVQDVPGFQFILWHIGNDDDDTAGCLLLGDQAQQNVMAKGRITASTEAYRRVYPTVRDAIKAGPTFVRYVDCDG